MRIRPPVVVATLLVAGGALLGSAVQGIASLDAAVRALPARRALPVIDRSRLGGDLQLPPGWMHQPPPRRWGREL